MNRYPITKYKDRKILSGDLLVEGYKKCDNLYTLMLGLLYDSESRNTFSRLILDGDKDSILRLIGNDKQLWRLFLKSYLVSTNRDKLDIRNYKIDFEITHPLPRHIVRDNIDDKYRYKMTNIDRVSNGSSFIYNIYLLMHKAFPDEDEFIPDNVPDKLNIYETKDRIISITNRVSSNRRYIRNIMYTLGNYFDSSKTTLEEYDIVDPVDDGITTDEPYSIVDDVLTFNIFSKYEISKVRITNKLGFTDSGKLNNVINGFIEYTLGQNISKCINEQGDIKSLLPILGKDLDKWDTLKSILMTYDVLPSTNKNFVLGLLYIISNDRFIINIDRDILYAPEELKLKFNYRSIPYIFMCTTGSYEVVKTMLYKLLNKVFPSNKLYWKMSLVNNMVEGELIFKTDDWEEPIRDLGVNEFISNDIVVIKKLLFILAHDYFVLGTDLPNMNSVGDYYNSIKDLVYSRSFEYSEIDYKLMSIIEDYRRVGNKVIERVYSDDERLYSSDEDYNLSDMEPSLSDIE